jgi:hypothetical protein
MTSPTKYVVGVERDTAMSVKLVINGLDLNAVFDPEGSPVIFWVTTALPVEKIIEIPGVTDAFISIEQP